MPNFSQRLIELTRDLINVPTPEQILNGNKQLRPFTRCQNVWLKHFYPGDDIQLNQDSWFYLQKYMLPMIKESASHYHLEGIKLLKLDNQIKPNFDEFKELFYKSSGGFEIEAVKKEIPPREYFTLIQRKKFPCITTVRPLNELFCANEPDFWHEAIGHIAPLCFPEVQAFYLEIAEALLSSKSAAEFERNVAVAWTLTEYGFIEEKGKEKMFGAALVGSHLAHMRYRHDRICIESADRAAIINSGFYSEDTPPAKDKRGRLRFFLLKDLSTENLFM